jgi:S1-C subfamily serine protease
MRRSVSPGVWRVVERAALAILIALGAFELGQAGAARSTSERRRTEVVEAVQHAGPAVVSVYADARIGRNRWRRGAGSGVIVHPSGYVVTNSHVIDGGRTVSVELFNEGGVYRAQVVANQPSHDLALLRIQRPGGFPYVSIARTSEVMLGEQAIAIGNPRGLGDTITVGVISALGRDAKVSRGTSLRNLIQTDASINSGNSGGALLNLDGELLGVIVSLMPGCTGIAFAVPGDQVRALLHRALGSAPPTNRLAPDEVPSVPTPPRQASGHRERPRATAATPGSGLPPPEVAQQGQRERTSAVKTRPLSPEDYGMELRDTGSRIRVVTVEPSGAASLAGLHVGDVVLAIDGRPVENQLDIVFAFSAARPGRVYQVLIRRGSLEKHVALITPR